LSLWVIDNDYTIAAWGTPVNPTYGLVASTAPAGYYNSLNGKSGAQLKQAIQDIIANPATVHAQNYGDVTDILKEADQNPLNSNQVWLMYVEQPRAKFKFQSTASNTGSWNREHIFPQSRGGFSDGTNSVADGIDNWSTTNADDIDAGHGDAHHIRAEDGPENSSRGNGDYGLNDYNGPTGTLGSWHGDVARALFYMACRYNGLSLSNGNLPDSTLGSIGDLATLLAWNTSDPADDFEMHHNNVVYNWQNNRNPFVDMPALARYVFGSNFGQVWNNSLALPDTETVTVVVRPNPARESVTISGVASGTVVVYSMTGVKVMETTFMGDRPVALTLPPGMYLATIASDGGTVTKKLVVR
ncbi:MAG TPA: endonuclease, partial [Flavobacterium sp.]|nr:endonuclease [Flavobacterium sp.]